jgi:transposase InsO family protein
VNFRFLYWELKEMSYNDDDWPVFWCSLLGPILLDDVPAGERRRFLRELSRQEVLLPNGRRKRLSMSTLRRKVRQFRQQKIAGLRRQPRHDRGSIRKQRDEMLRRAVELKKQQPRRSHLAINRLLTHEFGRTIPKSTLNRHLRMAGATRRKLGVSLGKIRCRWTRDHSNALWVGDFAEGPYVFHIDRVIKPDLSIWIDCHSRYTVEGRYYPAENLDILIDSLLRALGSHGAPRELYVDNAKIYRSRALRLACAQLNIHLLHRPPRDPPPGGLVERMIQTIQEQFESEIRASQTVTLDELNRYFTAWLHASYHVTTHSATGQTPLARFEEKTRFRRNVNMAEVLELFAVREKRTVNRDFCDVQIEHRFYAVDIDYRGDKVLVSYDPFSAMDEVRVFSLQGQFLQIAKRYERQRGAHPQPRPATPSAPLEPEYLNLLRRQHEEQLRQQARQGINYHAAQSRQLWSFSQFAAKFAKLLGRQGGASGLTADELERLAPVHRRYPRITARLLEQAFQRAEPKTIPVIIFQLQSLLSH